MRNSIPYSCDTLSLVSLKCKTWHLVNQFSFRGKYTKANYIDANTRTDPRAWYYTRLFLFTELCDECVVDGGWGYYPFQGSCNQYLHCSETAGAYLETCAVGTFYDGKICRHARDVKCPSGKCLSLLNIRISLCHGIKIKLKKTFIGKDLRGSYISISIDNLITFSRMQLCFATIWANEEDVRLFCEKTRIYE